MHTLIGGTTESGKSSLAKMLHASARKRGVKTIVLTPFGWNDEKPDVLTDNQTVFLDNYWKSENCFVFIDEGRQTVGRYNEAMTLTAVQGRHWGHSNFYIVQRIHMLHPDIREQCSQIFLFCSAPKSAESAAEEFVNDSLLEAPNLKRGEYIRCLRFGPDGGKFSERGKAFTYDPNFTK